MLNIISLKIDIKRREKIIKRCKQFKIPYKIHYGIDGKDYTFSNKEKYLLKNYDLKKKKGNIGCLLSHIYLLEKLVKTTKLNKFLICEDDAVILEPEFNKYIFYLMSKLQFNILHLANEHIHINKGKQFLGKIDKYNIHVSKGYKFQGTIMYIISRMSALHILNIFYSGLSKKPVDLLYINNIPKQILIYPYLAGHIEDNSSSRRKINIYK
jgi:GR25 family glycosyltransferase involved in LPS biosynthesis